MKKARKKTIAVMALLFVSIWVMMAAGRAAGWPIDDARAFGLAIVPTAIVAGLLVVYFDWRSRLTRRIRGEHHEYRNAA